MFGINVGTLARSFLLTKGNDVNTVGQESRGSKFSLFCVTYVTRTLYQFYNELTYYQMHNQKRTLLRL